MTLFSLDNNLGKSKQSRLSLLPEQLIIDNLCRLYNGKQMELNFSNLKTRLNVF